MLSFLKPMQGSGKEPSVKSLQTSIGKLTAELPGLKDAVRLATYDAIAEVDGAEIQLAAAQSKLKEVETQLSRLTVALDVAQQKETAHEDEQSVLQRQATLEAVYNALVDRDAAGQRLQDSLETAAKAWRDMVAHNDQALLAAGPVRLPDGGGVSYAALRVALASFLWKVAGGDGMTSPLAWPGLKAPTIQSVNDPASLPNIVDQLREGTAFVMQTLGGPNGR